MGQAWVQSITIIDIVSPDLHKALQSHPLTQTVSDSVSMEVKTPCKISHKLSYETTETSTYKFSSKITGKLKVSGSVGIPFISKGKVEVQIGGELSKEQVFTVSNKLVKEFNVEVSPQKNGHYQMRIIASLAQGVNSTFTYIAIAEGTQVSEEKFKPQLEKYAQNVEILEFSQTNQGQGKGYLWTCKFKATGRLNSTSLANVNVIVQNK